jgi:16S rRNA (cytidine1402-2'-O)-methyltransferase
VLLVSGAPLETGAIDSETERILKLVLKDLPLKQAVQLAAQIASSRRNELY